MAGWRPILYQFSTFPLGQTIDIISNIVRSEIQFLLFYHHLGGDIVTQAYEPFEEETTPPPDSPPEYPEPDNPTVSIARDATTPGDQPDTPVEPAPLEAQAGAPGESTITPAPELIQIQEAIQWLSARFQDLQEGFDSKIKYDASKERVIDTLHKELQAYREGLHFKILRPIFLDLISMHDDLNHLLGYDAGAETNHEAVLKLRRSLKSFQETIEEILERHGVEVYHEAGEEFVAQRQRAIKTIETNVREEDRWVAERIRKGFAYEGRVIRPEIVAIFRFVEQQKTKTQP
jgi:molecular chaperone GrpE